MAKTLCQWLSSALIAAVVSCVALVGVWIAFKGLRLDQRLGVDEGICLLALLAGPALIRVIHRSIAESAWLPMASLALGAILGGLGTWQILRANEAMARHVPSGPFSGIEHVFTWAFGFLAALVAALAVLGGALALACRGPRRN